MACQLFGATPLYGPKFKACQLDPKVHFKEILYTFISVHLENTFENIVCKMAAILCRP